MRAAPLAAVAWLALAGQAAAIVAVTEVDTSSSIAEYTPVTGQATVRMTTSDPVSFSNSGSTEREAITLSISHSFRYDSDGTTASSVTYQGTTSAIADLFWSAQSTTGNFGRFRLVTASDLTSETSGWTEHSACGTMTYQGTFSIPYYSNAGVAQTALDRYYMVCDSTRIWVDTDKNMGSGADSAYLDTLAVSILSAEADHEIDLAGVTYLFESAASASSVTLHQGHFVPLGATTISNYFLYLFPDGFPAGVTTSTITATALDITS